MSVFLTPDGRPFYGGTYFPDEPRHGMPSFRQVLEGVDRAWRDAARRGRGGRAAGSSQALVEQQARRRRRAPAMPDAASCSTPPRPRDRGLVRRRRNGGWGRAPKFPQPMTIEFLLRRHRRDRRSREPLAIARRTLDAMADGGIHDQLGGGFHRYSTDARWLVPALRADALRQRPARARLRARVGAHRRRGATRDVATGTLDYMLRELTTDDGGVRRQPGRRHRRRSRARRSPGAPPRSGSVARRRRADLFAAAYGVTDERQLGGRDDPVAGPRRRRARRAVRARPATRSRRGWPTARAALLARRASGRSRRATTRRSRPGTASRSRRFADAARSLAATGDPATARGGRYREAAERAAARDRSAACSAPDGPLGRSWKDGRASADGVLEDYAEPRRRPARAVRGDVRRALVRRRRGALMDVVLARFADPAGGFFDTRRRPRAAGHPAARTSRTTPSRRATRWRRPSCSGSPR